MGDGRAGGAAQASPAAVRATLVEHDALSFPVGCQYQFMIEQENGAKAHHDSFALHSYEQMDDQPIQQSETDIAAMKTKPFPYFPNKKINPRLNFLRFYDIYIK